MTLSIGPATDYLYTQAQTVCAAVTVNGAQAVAVDGWPYELDWGMFVVGLSAPPPDPVGDTTGTRSWASLGQMRLQEDYTIPCYIDVRVGEATQKQVRDLTASLFDPFWALLRADLTLGGVLGEGRYAEITDLTSTPSNVGTAAEQGRRQLVTFGVHCRNLTR